MNGKQLKNSILQWAIQGKLVPQDPNDEPASVLLERIREEKARLVKEGKIKKDKNESIIFRGDDNSHYEKFLATGEVKCIDDEIPFEIPEGWEWARGRHIFLPMQSTKPEGEYFTYIDIDAVNNKANIVDKPKRLPCSQAPSRATRKLEQNCILFSMVRPYLKNIALIGYEYKDAIASTGFYVIRPCSVLYPQYIFKLLLSAYVVDGLNQYMKGDNSPSINNEHIESYLYPIPPYCEQSRIVEKLDGVLPIVAKYDWSQSELDKLNEQLYERLKKSILQEAIQGKLVPQDPNDEPASVLLERIREEKLRLLKEGKLKKKDITDSVIFKGEDNKYYEQIGQEIVDINEDIPFEIPESWSWIRLSNICSICTGATFKKEDATQNQRGVRILRGGNILPFRICIKDDDIFIPRDAVKYNILLRQNDIVTPAVTSLENIGKMARIESDMPTTTVGGFVFILRPYLNDDILSEYLLSAMSAPATVEFMRSITNKSGQAFYNIGKERLSTTLIPVPPHVEQKRIIENIKHLFSKLS